MVSLDDEIEDSTSSLRSEEEEEETWRNLEKSFPEKVRVDDDWEVGKHDVDEEDEEDEDEEEEEEDGDDGAVKTTSSLIGMESSSSSDSLGVVRPGKDDNDVAEVVVKGAMETVVGRQNEADVDIDEEAEEEEGEVEDGANEALRG